MAKVHDKPLAQNRKARHDYHIIDTYEAGLVLKGTEIKAIRDGKITIQDGYISIYKGEAFLKNVHISPYDFGNIFNHDPLRTRKLLLHKKEILKLHQKIKEKGFTLVCTKIYLKNGRAKVEIALAKGKKNFDKRDSEKEKSQKREIERMKG